jgi:hypothetical protein
MQQINLKFSVSRWTPSRWEGSWTAAEKQLTNILVDWTIKESWKNSFKVETFAKVKNSSLFSCFSSLAKLHPFHSKLFPHPSDQMMFSWNPKLLKVIKCCLCKSAPGGATCLIERIWAHSTSVCNTRYWKIKKIKNVKTLDNRVSGGVKSAFGSDKRIKSRRGKIAECVESTKLILLLNRTWEKGKHTEKQQQYLCATKEWLWMWMVSVRRRKNENLIVNSRSEGKAWKIAIYTFRSLVLHNNIMEKWENFTFLSKEFADEASWRNFKIIQTARKTGEDISPQKDSILESFPVVCDVRIMERYLMKLW